MTYTQVRITTEQLAKLRVLSEKERRSMAAQLAILIDEAILAYGIKHPETKVEYRGL